MAFAIENLRLAELTAVTERNRIFFDDFIVFIGSAGYSDLHAFIHEQNADKAKQIILTYFERPLPGGVELLDGIARPYPSDKAKWLFLAWLLRDAPEQRLRPMISSIAGATLNERKANLLNQIRVHVATILPEPSRWTWAPISEVIADRLEGSRRAIKGTLFEAIVRRLLVELFALHKLALKVSDAEVRLEGETYDVTVTGKRAKILIPVKTRETMGGGHALLFTRDIHKSITAAHNANMECIPIVIAESWGGDFSSLNCKYYVYINKNPNQIADVEPLLRSRLSEIIIAFAELAV